MKNEQFRDRFLPEALKNADDLEKRDPRLLITMLITATIGSLLYEVYAYKLGLTYLNVLLTLNILFYLISLKVFQKTGNRLLSGNIFLAATYLLFSGIYVAGNGGASPGIVWFILFPLMAISATNIRFGVFWSILSSATAISISLYMHKNNIDMGIYTDLTRYKAANTNLILTPLIMILMTRYGFDTKESAISRSERKAAETEEILNERKKLLNILFHDLANPLQVIHARSKKALNSKIEDEDLRKQLERIYSAADIMTDITEYVKESIALEEGKKELTVEPVKISDLLKDLYIVFEDRMEEKDLTLKINSHGLGDKLVLGNKVALTNNVINNLISNAIKFSKRGGVICFDIKENGKMIDFAVCDNGIGISAEHMDSIFSSTTKTSTIGTEGEKGTGFGLPIVKQTINSFGGDVEVKSETSPENQGTTITFKLKAA